MISRKSKELVFTTTTKMTNIPKTLSSPKVTRNSGKSKPSLFKTSRSILNLKNLLLIKVSMLIMTIQF